jgi:hypothetical protein
VSARRGVANRVCNGNAPDCRNRVRIPRTYHGGLTPPALVSWRGHPPVKKRFVRCTNIHPARSGGRQPAVDVGNTLAQTRARLSARPPMVCGDRHCIRVQRHHGGLTPPALVLRCERPPAKKRFVRCTNARRKRAAGVSPPWIGERTCKHGHVQRCDIAQDPVSPPWIGERTCKGALGITRETAGDSSANAVAVALPQARQTDTCCCRRGTFSRRSRIPVSTRLPIHRRPTYAADVYVQ